MASLKGTAPLVFGHMMDQQTAWLGVPAVNTVGCGRIKTAVPNGLSTFLTFLPLAPWLITYLPQASQMHMSCDMVQGCKVIDASGRVLAELTQAQGETFAIAKVTLADERPSPQEAQPASPLSWFTYFISDVLLPSLTLPVYRQGLRRAWGERMAPVAASTRRWAVLLSLGVVAGFLLGLFLGRRRRAGGGWRE
jgi:hypothetical protein